MSYNDQLLDAKWDELKKRRLEHDWYMCQKCMSGKHLQVHHRYYIDGRKAWEYPLNALVTLCDKCHWFEHEKHGIRKETPLEASFRRIRETLEGIKKLNVIIANKQKQQNG
jgi:5-methylcytosine-specific restriction endonuclease McrA